MKGGDGRKAGLEGEGEEGVRRKGEGDRGRMLKTAVMGMTFILSQVYDDLTSVICKAHTYDTGLLNCCPRNLQDN